MRGYLRDAEHWCCCWSVLARGSLRGQKRHEIRMEADQEQGDYRFSPAQVTARPGDILVFQR